MSEDEGTGKAARRSKLKVAAIVAALLILTAIGTALLLSRKGEQKPSAALPTSVLSQISDFTPYAYPDNPPLGYQVNQEAVSFDQGVLFVTLQPPEAGPSFMLTEQAMPDDFANTEDLVGDETIRGADGKAVVSHREGRTIATMVSRDKKTLVILTGDGGSSTTVVSDLIRALKPVTLTDR
jgi:hypothetical protein